MPCSHVKADGAPCGAPEARRSGWCWVHLPGIEEERRAARSAGGRKGGAIRGDMRRQVRLARERAAAPPPPPPQVIERVVERVIYVPAGESPERARAWKMVVDDALDAALVGPLTPAQAAVVEALMMSAEELNGPPP